MQGGEEGVGGQGAYRGGDQVGLCVWDVCVACMGRVACWGWGVVRAACGAELLRDSVR